MRVGRLAFSYFRPQGRTAAPGDADLQWLADQVQPLRWQCSCGGEVPRAQPKRQTDWLWRTLHRVHNHRHAITGGYRGVQPGSAGHPLRPRRGAGSVPRGQQPAPHHRCQLATPPLRQQIGPPSSLGGPLRFTELIKVLILNLWQNLRTKTISLD